MNILISMATTARDYLAVPASEASVERKLRYGMHFYEKMLWHARVYR
jgi:hypothetical protein